MATYDARPSPYTQLSQTSDWEAVFSAAGISDGIDATQSIGQMTPSLDTGGRNAVIQPGNALIKGQLWRCDAAVSTPIPVASAQNRIDRLVLQFNRGATTSPTVIQPLVVTGTPGGSPVEPPLVQTPTGIFQIPICSWTSASSGALTGLSDERQIAIDSWHSLVIPSSPTGLTGSARYKIVAWNILKVDFNLQWSNPQGQTWSFTNLPQPWWPSIPSNNPRIYANLGNAVLNTASNSGLPRLFFGGTGAIQFVSVQNADVGAATWTLDLPMD